MQFLDQVLPNLSPFGILPATLIHHIFLFNMQLICPECKNGVDLTRYPKLAVGHVVECQMCGITLKVTTREGMDFEAEVMDEGK